MLTAIRNPQLIKDAGSGHRQNRRGLSLIEVVVSTLLISLVMVASLKTVGGVVRTWGATVDQLDGAALAQQMMSEILQAYYEEPGALNPSFGLDATEKNNNRNTYDDTDDYDEWSASPPQNKFKQDIAGYTGWTRSVDVQKVNPNNPSGTLNDNAPDQDLRRITVTVTDPQSRQTTLIGFRSADGIMERSPELAGTFITWVGSELQVGGSSTKLVTGTNVASYVTLSDAEALDIATMNGKYSSLLAKFYQPDDPLSPSEIWDYGWWDGGMYLGENFPAGYDVYVAGHWYVWEVGN